MVLICFLSPDLRMSVGEQIIVISICIIYFQEKAELAGDKEEPTCVYMKTDTKYVMIYITL